MTSNLLFLRTVVFLHETFTSPEAQLMLSPSLLCFFASLHSLRVPLLWDAAHVWAYITLSSPF